MFVGTGLLQAFGIISLKYRHAVSYDRVVGTHFAEVCLICWLINLIRQKATSKPNCMFSLTCIVNNNTLRLCTIGLLVISFLCYHRCVYYKPSIHVSNNEGIRQHKKDDEHIVMHDKFAMVIVHVAVYHLHGMENKTYHILRQHNYHELDLEDMDEY